MVLVFTTLTVAGGYSLVNQNFASSAEPVQHGAVQPLGAERLVVSDTLLAELERALAYPKLRARVTEGEAGEFVSLLHRGGILAREPPTPGHHSADPGDDYVLALAEHERDLLVSGDQHLLALADRLPIHSARAFLDALEVGSRAP